jgi:hypothetical protein
VDTDSHVICGARADYAGNRDSRSTSAIVGQTIENFSESGISVKEVPADTGYSSGESLGYPEKQDITAYIPPYGRYKSEREGFTCIQQEDCYVYSQGNHLSFTVIKEDSRRGLLYRRYRCSSPECGQCPIKRQCTGNAHCKQPEDSIDKPIYDRAYRRIKTPVGKRMKNLRSSTVESVLGTLLFFRGTRKVYSKGIVSASKHVLPVVSAYNLKKYMSWKGLKKAMSAIPATLASVADMKTGSFGQLLQFFTALLLFVSADDKNRMANERYC